MTSMALLTKRRLLKIEGAQALHFLQGLLTADVQELPARGAQYAALLSAQGKFLHAFFLYWHHDAVWLETGAAELEQVRTRLMRYRLRAKIDITDTNWQVAAFWPSGSVPPKRDNAFVAPDPRLDALGFRVILPASAALAVTASAEQYDLWRLQHGIPEPEYDMVSEKSFPLPYGFEDMHAVSFTKGCYVGQEVTARTKHLGRLRKILVQVQAESGTLPEKGAALLHDAKAVGEMLSKRDGIGLAMVEAAVIARGDMLKSAAGSIIGARVPGWFLQGKQALAQPDPAE